MISPSTPGSIQTIIAPCAVPPLCGRLPPQSLPRPLGTSFRHGRYRRAIARSALPALLPAIIAERSLARLKRAGHDPFAPALTVPDTMQNWRLAVASFRERF